MCCTNLRLLVLLFLCVFFRLCAIAFLIWHIQIFCNPYLPKIIATTLPVRLFRHPKVSPIFLQWSCVAKYCHTRPFRNIFMLFRVPLVHIYPTAPMCIHNHSICTHPYPLCLHRLCMAFWGNFPAIRSKIMSWVAIYGHDCLVFLSARAPAPYCTHPDPSASICTYLLPPTP